MKVITIKDMIRKDVPIYYRLLFTGVAVIELNKGPENFRIDFTIEIKPTGQRDVSVTFIDKVDYPLIPVTNELKAYIKQLDSAGGLPD
ncbi:MAG: hypothetical protein FWC01_01800 [Treponema sp.]|nr:hypothetical protein [Treponema sp.]MCL2236830.1 hypothetical protein [Treponema sp.]